MVTFETELVATCGIDEQAQYENHPPVRHDHFIMWLKCQLVSEGTPLVQTLPAERP